MTFCNLCPRRVTFAEFFLQIERAVFTPIVPDTTCLSPARAAISFEDKSRSVVDLSKLDFGGCALVTSGMSGYPLISTCRPACSLRISPASPPPRAGHQPRPPRASGRRGCCGYRWSSAGASASSSLLPAPHGSPLGTLCSFLLKKWMSVL